MKQNGVKYYYPIRHGLTIPLELQQQHTNIEYYTNPFEFKPLSHQIHMQYGNSVMAV